MGFEPENTVLDRMSLRKLGITSYKALISQQYSIHGFTELSTLSELAAIKSVPVKKLRAWAGLSSSDKRFDNNSLQAVRAAPALLHGKTLGGLCRQFVGHVAICVSGFALRPPVFPFPQDGADAMDVPGHYSQRHVALEPVKAMIRTVIKTMDLQCVDR